MSTQTKSVVNVFPHDTLGLVVSGREVYGAITESKANRDAFSDWFRSKQDKLGLIEGRDFVETSVLLPSSSTGRRSIEHILTIDAAKRIASIQSAKRGIGLVAYLDGYTRSTTVASKFTPATDTAKSTLTLFAQDEVASADVQTPAPDPVILSPVQQLLAEVQKLAAQEEQRKNEPTPHPDAVKGLELRLGQLEKQVSVILYFFQQASTALRSLAPAQLPVDLSAQADLPALTPTTRMKIVRLVDGYAAAKTVTHQEVWKHIYGHLSSRYGFDAWQYGQGKKDPNYLDIIEENGQLENLYSIAVELLTLAQR